MLNSYEKIISIIKSRDADEEAIELISRSRFISNYKVKKLIVFHPSTPLKISLRYLNYLLYKDLERLVNVPFVSNVLKKKAIKLLVTRYEGLTAGEKSELSRSTRIKELFYLLLKENSPILWEQTLFNPNLFEKELIIFIRTILDSSDLATVIFENKRWRSNYKIRRALAYSIATPFEIVGLIGEELLVNDFVDIFNDDSIIHEKKSILWSKFKEKISLLSRSEQLLFCEFPDIWVINALIEQKRGDIVKKLLRNPKLSYKHIMFIKNNIDCFIGLNGEDKEEVLLWIKKRLIQKKR